MKILITATLALLVAQSARPYKEPVHQLITEKAFDVCAADFKKTLGISRDVKIDNKTPKDFMRAGAAEEDIVPRPANHFFDPVHEAPLTVGFWPYCRNYSFRAADRWALDDSLVNGRDLADAKRHYSNAVLGRDALTRATHSSELFITLGHLVHLVQDMAQPEHTRNDQHLTFGDQLDRRLFGRTAPSIWEVWGGERLVRRKLETPQGTITIEPAVSFEGYETVKLPDYASYFHTADKAYDGRSAGKGMADFSNRSFVTQDTNYGDSSILRCYHYPEAPRLSEAVPRTVRDARYALMSTDGTTYIVTVDEEVYTSFPIDHYLQRPEIDNFHTFLSLLDLETRKYGTRTFSLGDGSYLSRASLLIPRAVGYSAGFIEHFFRGKVDAQWTETEPGTYAMTITNRSSEPIGPEARITAIYRATPEYFGRSDSVDTAFIADQLIFDLVPGFGGLQPGARVTIPNVRPVGLKPGDSLTKFERRVVVTGSLGSEADAVIGLVQEPQTTASNLRVEISWDNPSSLFDLAALSFDGGWGLLCCYTFVYRPCDPFQPYGVQIPGTRVEASSCDQPPALAIDIDRVEPGRTYLFEMLDQPLLNDPARSANVRVKVLKDGIVVRDASAPVASKETKCLYVFPESMSASNPWCVASMLFPTMP